MSKLYRRGVQQYIEDMKSKTNNLINLFDDEIINKYKESYEVIYILANIY